MNSPAHCRACLQGISQTGIPTQSTPVTISQMWWLWSQLGVQSTSVTFQVEKSDFNVRPDTNAVSHWKPHFHRSNLLCLNLIMTRQQVLIPSYIKNVSLDQNSFRGFSEHNVRDDVSHLNFLELKIWLRWKLKPLSANKDQLRMQKSVLLSWKSTALLLNWEKCHSSSLDSLPVIFLWVYSCPCYDNAVQICVCTVNTYWVHLAGNSLDNGILHPIFWEWAAAEYFSTFQYPHSFQSPDTFQYPHSLHQNQLN